MCYSYNVVMSPENPGWCPSQLIKDVGDLLVVSGRLGFHGPFVLLFSQEWSVVLDAPYIPDGHQHKCEYTVRERLIFMEAVKGIAIGQNLSRYEIQVYQGVNLQ